MSKHLFLLVALFCFIPLSHSQTYDIIFPTTEAERNQTCKQCFSAFQQKPKEVKFSIKRDGNYLFFETNDKAWVKMLFKNANDGLAIDVVARDYYNCDEANVNEQIRGKLLKPIYTKRIISGLQQKGDNFRVRVATLPADLLNKELEYNILFLNNKTFCMYYVIYNLKAYNWDLLDMGMYLNAVTYKNQDLTTTEEVGFKIKYKSMRFIIPFEKNKSEYSPEDIRPLYDSLNLTDFNIKTININAYSSIEGSLERNIELQEQRAKSIANALQSYQKPTIETTISSSENWVEFLNDISNTKYDNLRNLSKPELKAKLVGAFSKEMEPYLKNHRKAVVTLELEKKDKYKTMSQGDLIDLFNSSLNKDQLDEAEQIQNSIFEKLKNKVLSPDVLQKMNIPEQLKYVNLANSNSAIKYQLNERQIIIVRDELKRLLKLDPKNPRVIYNLTAIKLKIWRYNFEEVNENKLKAEINTLKKYGIDQVLIDRMMVNYHIIRSEKLMRKRDYANKDKSVNYIYNNYKKIPLSDIDYFSLAQFLAYYANIEKAAELLKNQVTKIDVDEDLLFYYLNLTLTNKSLTQTDSYRTIMLNAVNLNKLRFCKLFDSPEKDGVTFQLMQDEFLKNSYCENCSD